MLDAYNQTICLIRFASMIDEYHRDYSYRFVSSNNNLRVSHPFQILASAVNAVRQGAHFRPKL